MSSFLHNLLRKEATFSYGLVVEYNSQAASTDREEKELKHLVLAFLYLYLGHASSFVIP